jgi:hypothetical protein
MQNQFSRAHQFLAGLAVKSEPALHDAFVAEVLETAGALVIPDDKSADFYEITLHGITAFGATEAELFRNWAIHARHALDTRRSTQPNGAVQ